MSNFTATINGQLIKCIEGRDANCFVVLPGDCVSYSDLQANHAITKFEGVVAP